MPAWNSTRSSSVAVISFSVLCPPLLLGMPSRALSPSSTADGSAAAPAATGLTTVAGAEGTSPLTLVAAGSNSAGARVGGAITAPAASAGFAASGARLAPAKSICPTCRHAPWSGSGIRW